MTAGRAEEQAAAAAVAAGEAFTASLYAQELREAESTNGGDVATGTTSAEPPAVEWPS